MCCDQMHFPWHVWDNLVALKRNLVSDSASSPIYVFEESDNESACRVAGMRLCVVLAVALRGSNRVIIAVHGENQKR